MVIGIDILIVSKQEGIMDSESFCLATIQQRQDNRRLFKWCKCSCTCKVRDNFHKSDIHLHISIFPLWTFHL